MADDWLGINSTHLDDLCGQSPVGQLVNALNGSDSWDHAVNETHWFVLDLGATHVIKKVRGRSFSVRDPTDVNIYIDDNNPPTTLCEEGITTWQDRDAWSEITLTSEGTGQYIKVEIEGTEDLSNYLSWGRAVDPFTIFDAYGDIYVPPPPAVLRPTVAVGNPLIF